MQRCKMQEYLSICGTGRPATLDGAGRSTALGEEDNVRPIGDVVAVSVSEGGPDVVAVVAHDAVNLGRRIVDERPAYLFVLLAAKLSVRAGFLEPVGHDDADGLVLSKVALDVDDTDGEETRLVRKRLEATPVNVDGAVGGEGV